MKSLVTKVALLALAGSLSGSMIIGCSSSPTDGSGSYDESVGSVGLNLDIAPGIEVTSVHYSVSNAGGEVIAGDIPVSDPGATVSVLIGGLAPGDYTITMNATSTDGEVDCLGSTDFTISTGATTLAHVDLQCSSEDATGSVQGSGSFNQCPVIGAVTAAPLQTSTNGTIVLTSTASDINAADPISFTWSASGGSFVSSTAANTTYNCSDPGTQTLTLTVGDGSECVDTFSFQVSCVQISCGDGVIQAGEDCDDSNANNFDACPNDCKAAICGDGVIDGLEQCDDGDAINTNNCTNLCKTPSCGDGIVSGGEQCDPPGVGCSATCQSLAVCGNGVQEAGEACDDNNLVNGDGCESNCTVTPTAVCGDGAVNGTEACDPPQAGNCNSDCGQLTSTTCLACELADPTLNAFVTLGADGTPGAGNSDICNLYSNADVSGPGTPAAGVGLRDLCYDMLECIRSTECSENGGSKCYCGSSSDCSAPNGDCKTVVERSLQSALPGDIAVRFFDLTYPGAGALVQGNFDSQTCKAACYPNPALPLHQ